MDGELTPAEQQAWEAHLSECAACRQEWEALMSLDDLFQSAPAVALSEDFTARTLARLEKTKRRRKLWSVLGFLSLAVLVLVIEILVLGSALVDFRHVALVLFSSQDLLGQTLMRLGVGLIAMAKSLSPFFLGLAGLLMLFLMPNGILATATVVLVRRKRKSRALGK